MRDYKLVGNGGDGNVLHREDDRDALAEASLSLEEKYEIETEIREARTGGA